MAEQKKYKTRYQEALEILIKTKKENGKEVVDGNTWTPHNVRKVIFDAKGILLIYFTTNKYTQRLIEYIPFKDIKGPELIMQELEQGKRLQPNSNSMIDALHKRIVFSNVEEIAICIGNFETDIELQEETRGFQNFHMNNLLKQTSFKRLKNLIIVEAQLIPEEFKKLNPDVDINTELDRACIKYQIERYEPEKDEYGVIKNVVLDSVKYKLDASYDPAADSKERNSEICRLSKWFHDERERAKRKYKEVKKQAEQQVEEDEYDEQLLKAVNATINRLEMFYNPIWNGKYLGILHEDGLKFTEPGKSDKKVKSKINAVYSAWKEVVVKNGIVEDIEKITFNTGVSYSPGFHYNVLKSKEVWTKGKDDIPSVKKKLEKSLLKKYSEVFEDNPDKINELSSNLTNCIVITKWGKNDFFLRFTGVKQEQKDEFVKVFERSLSDTYLAGSQPGMVASCEIDSNGIGTLTYIVNWQEFLDEILFAYKQYTDYGVKPSLTDAVLGLKMDGKPLTVNLLEANKILTTILAGSGSGKGVMTMGLLASLFGAGGSVVYLDYKPDIAGMLWDLEREYVDKGLKLLAVDVGKEKHETTGAVPVRTGALNLLEVDERKSTQFRMLRLAKLFQLVTLIGKYKCDIEGLIKTDISNLFFIIDELTSINTDFTDLSKYIDDKETEYKSKASKVKVTEEDKQLSQYYTKLKDIIDGMNTDFVQGVTKDWRMSGLKVIAIGQELSTNWKVKGKKLSTSFAGRLLSGTHYSLSGVAQATDYTFKFNESQSKLSKQRGVFAFSTKPPIAVSSSAATDTDMRGESVSDFKQFRSFFSLVRNDFDYGVYSQLVEQTGNVKEGLSQYVSQMGGRFTTQLLSGFINKSEQFIEGLIRELYDFEKGCNREEVSFSGLLKIMQEKSGISEEKLISNMNKGYEVIDGLFRALGFNQKYNSVEEYLCDCSPEGVFTLNELKGMLGLEGMTYTPINEQKVEDNEEIDLGVGNYDVDYESEIIDFNQNEQKSENQFKQSTQQTINNQGRPSNNQDFNSQDRPKRPTRPQRQQKQSSNYQNLGIKSHMDTLLYKDTLEVEKSPYKEFNEYKKYIGNNNSVKIKATKDMTKLILKDIEKIVGGVANITKFEILGDGVLVFNNTVYIPSLEESFIKTLPDLEMKTKVKQGILVDVFNLRAIYKFKNLQELIIENRNLVQGRARKEMGIGYRKRFSVLFGKFRDLSYINVYGIEYTRENPDTSGEEDYLLPKEDFFKGLFKSKTPLNTPQVSGLMSEVWNSKPVKILTNAFGWTMGTQAVIAVATLMGPMGLLFGALAMAGAYKEIKDSKVSSSNMNVNSSKGNKSEVKAQKSNSNKSSNKKNKDKGNTYYNGE